MNNLNETLKYITSVRRQWHELTLQKLDIDKINFLKKKNNLINSLYRWTIFPDASLVGDLRELGIVVENLYSLPRKLTVYRGFNRQSAHQDTMGLVIDEQGLNKEKVHTYSRTDRCLSFTTDPEIARSYGDVVVKTELDLHRCNALVITDELAHLVSEKRGELSQTQKEVIVLAPFLIHFQIQSDG